MPLQWLRPCIISTYGNLRMFRGHEILTLQLLSNYYSSTKVIEVNNLSTQTKITKKLIKNSKLPVVYPNVQLVYVYRSIGG